MILLLGVLVGLVGAGVEVAADAAGTGVGLVVRVVVGVLAAPISALAAAVLYFDLRRAHGGGPGDRGAGPPSFQSSLFLPTAP